MASPVTPTDFKNVVSDPTTSLCGGFTNALLKLPTILYQFINWLLGSDGNVTQPFRRQIVKPGDLIFSAAPLATDASRLLCDGSQVSQATYPDLYAAIGVVYGAASPGNFKLPDFRARFPVGVGTLSPSGTVLVLGSTAGADQLQLVANNIPKIQLGLECTAGTDNRWYAGEGTGPNVNGDGIGALGTIATRAKIQTEPFGNLAGDTTKGQAITTVSPYLAVYIYIAT